MGRRKKEVWVQLIDERIKPLYFISSHGNIKNLKGKYIHPYIDKDGYHRITLQGYNKKIHKYVHILVASHFLLNPDPKKYTQVNHKNFIKSNNYYKNLEYCTQHDNIRHSVKYRRQLRYACSAHGMATMTNEEVHEICKLFENGLSIKEVLNHLGYYKKDDSKVYEKMRGKLKHIRNRKTWVQISHYYKF